MTGSTTMRLHTRVLGATDTPTFRAMLALFGDAFEEPETYGSKQPDDHYLWRLLESDTFVAIATLEGSCVVGKELQPR